MIGMIGTPMASGWQGKCSTFMGWGMHATGVNRMEFGGNLAILEGDTKAYGIPKASEKANRTIKRSAHQQNRMIVRLRHQASGD